MAFDCFLKMDGIDGESEDDAHAKWVEVLSYSHGLSQSASGTVSSSGGRTTGRADFQDFSISKTLDATTPKLNQYCASGKHIPTIELSMHRSDGDKPEFMNYKLEDAIISSVQVGGAGGGDIPIESVTFTFGKITWKYTPTDHKTGKGGTAVPTSWDLHKNVKS